MVTDTVSKIIETVEKCNAHGHVMVDCVGNCQPNKPMHIVHCKNCMAILRYYKGLWMGEAIQTTCKVKDK